MRAIVYAVVAFIGVVGEVFLLRHELVDCYPFKIMSYPPAGFYEHVAIIGGVGVLLFAVGASIFSAARWPEITPAALTFLGPIVAIGILAIATSIFYGWSVPALTHNFDETTIVGATWEFAKVALAYSAAGLVGGSAVSSLLSLLLRERGQDLAPRRRHLHS